MTDITMINMSAISPEHADLPIGPLSLVSVLEENGYHVVFDDYQTYEDKDKADPRICARYLSQWDSPVMGISVSGLAMPTVLGAMCYLRAERPDLTVILGGPAPGLVADPILQSFPVDAVVRGEGEATLVAVMRALADGLGLDDVPGLSYRRDGRVIHNPPRARIVDLDALPRAAYHLIDWADYEYTLPISYARGCVAPRLDCSCSKHWGQQVVVRSLEHCIAEVAAMTPPVKIFGPQDDILLTDEGEMSIFLQTLRAEGITTAWGLHGPAEYFSLQLVQRIADHGCTTLLLSVPSASPRLLQKLGLACDLHRVEQAIEEAVRCMRQVIITYLWGYPCETLEDLYDTVVAAAASATKPGVWPVLIPVIPLPGSALWNGNKRGLRFSLEGLNLVGDDRHSVRVEKYPELQTLIQAHPDLMSHFYLYDQPDLEHKFELIARLPVHTM